MKSVKWISRTGFHSKSLYSLDIQLETISTLCIIEQINVGEKNLD